MRMIIERYSENKKQTEGKLTVLSTGDAILFSCFTLELPDLDNEPQVSRIPAGVYQVKKRHSPKFNEHFHILDVPGRSWILIHQGNYYTQIRGCILVGLGMSDMNGDGLKDVTQSVAAMGRLNALMPEQFQLTIVEY